MRWERLRSRNFRHHLNVDVTFGLGLTAIVGPNGSGKTTLLEAVAYCLFGTKALNSPQGDIVSNLPSSDGRSTRVEFEFFLEWPWRIVREPGAATVFQDGRSVCEGSDACAEYVATQIFGMDWSEWSTTLFAGQKSLDWLKGKKRADRERFLSDQLGYGVLVPARQISRDAARKLEGSIDALKESVRDPETLTELISSKEAEVEQSQARVGRCKDRMTELKDERSKTLAAVEELEMAEVKHRQLEQDWRKADTAASTARMQIDSDLRQIELIEADLKGVDEMTATIADAETKLELGKKERETFDKYIAGLEEELAAVDAKLIESRDAMTTANNRRARADAALGDLRHLDKGQCPTCKQEISQDEFNGWLETASTEVTAAKEECTSVGSDLDTITEDVRTRREELSKERRTGNDSFQWIPDLRGRTESLREQLAALDEKRLLLSALKAALGPAQEESTRLAESVLASKTATESHEFDSELLATRKRAHTALVANYETALTVMSTAERTSDTETAALESLKASEARNNESVARLETARGKLIVAKSTDRMFGDLRRHLTERIRPDLSERSTALITEMTRGRFTSLTLDGHYKPVLMSRGRKIPLASGGEWDVANLALRLATADLMADRTRRRLDVIALDEALAFVDDERAPAVVDALRAVTESRFEQVFLVTHDARVRDSVDHLIETSLDANEVGLVTTSA